MKKYELLIKRIIPIEAISQMETIEKVINDYLKAKEDIVNCQKYLESKCVNNSLSDNLNNLKKYYLENLSFIRIQLKNLSEELCLKIEPLNNYDNLITSNTDVLTKKMLLKFYSSLNIYLINKARIAFKIVNLIAYNNENDNDIEIFNIVNKCCDILYSNTLHYLKHKNVLINEEYINERLNVINIINDYFQYKSLNISELGSYINSSSISPDEATYLINLINAYQKNNQIQEKTR